MMNAMPPELLISVLMHLPFFMILRTREVCRLWLQLIHSSVALEYQIELGVHRKIDGPHSSLSIVDRLKILRRHAAAWRDLSWTRRELFNLEGLVPRSGALEKHAPHMMHLLGDWFDGRQIRVSLHGLPSTLVPTPSNTSGPDGSSFGITLYVSNVIMDAEQDILIFVEPDELPTLTPWRHIRLQTLSTALDTPAESRILRFPYSGGSVRVYVEEVMDDLLLVRSYNQVEWKTVAVVLQWTTGRTVSRLETLPPPYIPSFTFISNRHFLVTNAHYSEIAVYEFYISPQVHEVTVPIHVASYLLPKASFWSISSPISVRSHPPATSSARWPSKPFTDSADDWILCFELKYRRRSAGREIEGFPLHVITHASTLLRSTASGTQPMRIPWAQWGQESARCLPWHDMQIEARVYGERCAIPLPHNSGKLRVCVYDFNQTRVRRARQASTDTPGWPSSPIGRAVHSQDDSTSHGDTIEFGSPGAVEVISRLPYLATIVELDVNDTRRVDIDEERLIFPMFFENDPLTERIRLGVFTM